MLLLLVIAGTNLVFLPFLGLRIARKQATGLDYFTLAIIAQYLFHFFVFFWGHSEVHMSLLMGLYLILLVPASAITSLFWLINALQKRER